MTAAGMTAAGMTVAGGTAPGMTAAGVAEPGMTAAGVTEPGMAAAGTAAAGTADALPTLTAMSALAAGTFLLRLAGPALRTRVGFPERAERLLEVSAVLLLAALAATAALTEGHAFAGPARPLGVLVGGVLAWRRAPFLVVVLAAAGTAALLRVAGFP